MIDLKEDGRSLVVTVGGEQEFRFPPLSSRDGMTLALNVLGTMGAFGAADLGVDATAAGEASVNAVLGEQAEAVLALRDEEVTAVYTAVMLWQVKGGSFELARTSVTDSPKAIRGWLVAVSPLLMTSSPSGEQSETSTAGGGTRPTSSPPSKPKPKPGAKKNGRKKA